jgi:hypothetical protein
VTARGADPQLARDKELLDSTAGAEAAYEGEPPRAARRRGGAAAAAAEDAGGAGNDDAGAEREERFEGSPARRRWFNRGGRAERAGGRPAADADAHRGGAGGAGGAGGPACVVRVRRALQERFVTVLDAFVFFDTCAARPRAPARPIAWPWRWRRATRAPVTPPFFVCRFVGEGTGRVSAALLARGLGVLHVPFVAPEAAALVRALTGGREREVQTAPPRLALIQLRKRVSSL